MQVGNGQEECFAFILPTSTLCKNNNNKNKADNIQATHLPCAITNGIFVVAQCK